MPVSVACDSSGVMNAIRGGLASPLVNVNYTASNDNSQAIQNRLIASAKRVLFTKIEYEETSGYNESILDILKSKYIILKPNQCGRLNLSVDQDESAKETNQNQFCFGVPAQKDANQLPKPKKVLYPRNLVQIGWHSSGRKWQIGAGMINVGNTCYLNSTLQALFHVPAMANWLMSDVAHREKCENEDGSSGGCIICAMSKTLISSQTSQSPIRPYLVYTKLRLVCKHLIMGRQEDAHEFLRYLVEAMEKSYLARIPNSKEFDQYIKETTPLNQILGGYLKSAVRCLSCGHVSTTFQHFQDILLDIRKANSIEEALDLYFARERLEDMGYKCEACKKKVSATKQFSLERAPISLCIQLKRFSMMGSKLNKHVTIRPRLDLSPYAGKKCKENLSYKLVAMVTHLGASQHCGHYTAIGLTESGAYYQFDDSYVRPISLQNVVNTNAYIIFYELDDNKEMNRQSSSITREINMFKQSPSRSDASTNGNENETQKQNFTAAANKKPETEGAKSSVEFLEPSQKCDAVSSSVLTISSSDSFYKKTVMPNSTNSSKEGINGKTSAKANELNLNSQVTSSSLPSLNRVIQFEKPSSNSTKVTSTVMNGISEDRLPNGLWSPKKFCGPEQFSPRKSPQVAVAKVNGGSTSNIHEYLHTSSDKNDFKSPNKAGCSKPNDHNDKVNVLSLVPYDSDEESEPSEEFSKREKSPTNSFKDSTEPDSTCSDNMCDTSSYYSKDYRAQPSKIPRTIPSPPVVKTKAGLWKVSDISEEKNHKDESSNNNSINTKSVTKNPFASEPCVHIKSKDFYNSKDQQNHNKSNGRNDTDKKEVNILHHLLKSPHQDHRRPILTWWGQKSSSEKQGSNQPKQDRKRDMYDEEDEMMEAGRQKKRKSNNSCHNSNPGYNPFQEYQNNGSHQRRWNNNPYRRYRPNNNHRNNNFHRQGYNKKRAHRQRNHMDMNGYRHRRNS